MHKRSFQIFHWVLIYVKIQSFVLDCRSPVGFGVAADGSLEKFVLHQMHQSLLSLGGQLHSKSALGLYGDANRLVELHILVDFCLLLLLD